MERGNYAKAIACFGRSLDLDPADSANYAERGQAYLLMGDADAAIADFTRFIDAFGESGGPGRPSMTDLEVEEIGDATVVTFTESEIIDPQTIQVLGEELSSLVDELGRKKIVLNLENVRFMASGILGKFVALNKKLRIAGGHLGLCNLAPQIHEVLEITKLNLLFKIGPHPLKDLYETADARATRQEPSDAADFLASRSWRIGLAIAHGNRGAAHACKGDNEAAIADFTEAIRLHHTFAGAYVNRGNAYASTGDYRGAIADYTEAIRIEPHDASL